LTDDQLLRQYVEIGDQEAFAAIVRRYVDLVYAAAMRQLHDHCQAEEATQAVFIVLARKARRVDGQTLPGWLIKTARFIAMEARRAEIRRKIREMQVAAMKTESDPSDKWPRISELLDEALSHLGAADRTAITLRYLQGYASAQVAAAMGVSESAASKRLTRALAKLRKRFARRGIETPLETLGAAMLANARLASPPDLAAKSITAAIQPVTVAAGAVAAHSAAQALASTAISSSTILAIPSAIFYTAAAVVISTAASIGSVKIAEHFHPLTARPSTETLADPPPRTGLIRVGLLLSEFTITGPHASPAPYALKDGYLDTFRALRDDPGIQVVPVIEPGTENATEIAAVLHSGFRGITPIDASHEEQLMTLDVIACQRVWNETPQVLANIESAVRTGKGLLVLSGIGLGSPGIGTPPIDALNGLKQGIWEYCSVGADCQVVAPNPLLGSLKTNDYVTLPANGECGILADGATGLIGVSNLDDVHEVSSPQPIPANYAFYPLIMSRLGSGRIVNCQFTSWEPIPDDLQKPTNGKFLIHCVDWAANHVLE
jgi:RNA polymerase sigma factor (sigma-70 family)